MMPWLERKHEIETPEGVRFGYRLATPIPRFLAWLVDESLIIVTYSAIIVLWQVASFANYELAVAVHLIVFFTYYFGFRLFFEAIWRGQTPGKKILRLRVIDQAGLRLGFDQIFVRNILRIVDQLPYLYAVGGAVSFFGRRHQRLGDLAAGTVVIREVDLREVDLAKVGAVKFNSLARHAHLVALLRQRTPPELAHLALDALRRRENFTPSARLAVFDALATRFQELARFPEVDTTSLTSEQYVRNCVILLFAPTRR